MDIQQTADTGVTLKFSAGAVAVNPPETGRRAQSASVILTTYPVPIAGWGGSYTPADGQKIFTSPGEYEKDTLIIQGYGAGTVLHDRPIQTTSWRISGDDITVLVLGDMDEETDARRIITENAGTDVLVILCPESGEKRLSAGELAGIAASLQAKRTALIGGDTKLKKEIADNIGASDEVTDRCVLKRKDVTDSLMRAILFV